MPTRSLEDGYQDDLSVGRVDVGGDAQFYLDANVDGTGGSIRDKPVFTADQIAWYLNRGDGVITYQGVGYNSGANWDGAQGTANNQWYSLAVSNTNGGENAFWSLGGTGATAPLTTINFGFYESQATLPDPYVYTRASDGTNAHYIGLAVASGFSAFDSAQRDAARQAIAAWDELINVNFVETDAAHGDINYMNTTTGPIQASAYLPYDYGRTSILQDDGTYVNYSAIAGDVFVNPNQPSNHQFDEGQYGLTTLIHETGHSLGLEHPGAYNFGPGFAVTYDNGAEYYQDSRQYSIMSYWDAEETGASHVDWGLLSYRYASTPGIHDILAIQRIYGADMTTRNGNDTYGFNMNLSTHGLNDDSYNFVETPAPVIAIWDGGGIDTLDLSGYNTPSVIDLNPGAFSSAGGTFSDHIPTLAEINANRAAVGLAPRDQATYDIYVQEFGDTYTNGVMRDNIGIAYNVTIENAVGGGGDDTITGNSVANVLTGNAGNDVLKGMDGNDTLNGGLGKDKIEGGIGNDNVRGGDGIDLVNLGAGNDVFVAEFGATKTATKTGTWSWDVISDFDQNGDDLIDLTGLGLHWDGSSANKDAGDLTYKVYTSLNGAENALGLDIDGLSGATGVTGPVTVVYGNDSRGGSPDFAIILLNTNGVDQNDFIFDHATQQAALAGTSGGTMGAHADYLFA